MSRRQVVLAKPPTRFESVASFEARDRDPKGVVEINHRGLPIHFFLDPRGSDVTFVTFSGAVSAKVEHAPAWAGFGTSSHLGVNRMLISDPSILLDKSLRLAWYAGSDLQPDLQATLTTLIRSVARDTRIVMFGPSGGGFASLLQAARLPKSTAIVSNPQTDVLRFNPVAVAKYLRLAWGRNADEVSPFVHEVTSLYVHQMDVDVIYVQNAGDSDHVEHHLKPFRETAHPSTRLHLLMPDLGPGHIGPDKGSFMRLFSAVCGASADTLATAVSQVTLTRNM